MKRWESIYSKRSGYLIPTPLWGGKWIYFEIMRDGDGDAYVVITRQYNMVTFGI